MVTTVRIKNKYINNVVSLLYHLNLKGSQSRHRTKFIVFLNRKMEELKEERKGLIGDYAAREENGEYKRVEGDPERIVIANPNEFAKEERELFNEELVIDGGDNEKTLLVVKKLLTDLDVEFSGQEAEIYNYLCEQFKVDEYEEEDENEHSSPD